MLPGIIGMILGIAFMDVVNFRAKADAGLIKGGNWIKHGNSALWAISTSVVINLIAIVMAWQLIVLVPFLLAIYWFYFDLTLNIERKLPFWYIGQPDGDGKDALTDRILWALPYRYVSQYILKGLVIFLTYKLVYIVC